MDKPYTDEYILGLEERIKELDAIVQSTHFLMMDGWLSQSMITKESMRRLGLRCQKALGLPSKDIDWF